MPHPNWTHTCRKTGRTKTDWKPFRCWRCFGQAEFSGWSNSVVEMMGDYQRQYGLICIGPHRPLADRVFAGAFTRCDACGGSGYHDGGAHRSWVLCEGCNGLGRRPAVSEEDIARRRAIVLEAFPDAGRPPTRRIDTGHGGRSGACVAQAAAATQATAAARRGSVVSTGSPHVWELLRATIFVLLLAPAWLFSSIWAFRGGQLLVGAVLLFASAFAALSGLAVASPSSFGRKWLWVWGALGVGLFLLLGIITGQAASVGN